MIEDVDASIRALLESRIPPSEAAIRFEAPTAEWWATAGEKAACLNLFLHDVVEDQDGRSADWLDVRSDIGQVVARQPPVRHYRLTYLVSAWAQTTERSHAVLGRALRAVAEADVLPREFLQGSISEEELPIGLALAEPTDRRVRPNDLWSALGTPPRACFELVVRTPLRPAPIAEIAALATELHLGVHREDMTRPHAASGSPGTATEKRWTSFRVRETSNGGEER